MIHRRQSSGVGVARLATPKILGWGLWRRRSQGVVERVSENYYRLFCQKLSMLESCFVSRKEKLAKNVSLGLNGVKKLTFYGRKTFM